MSAWQKHATPPTRRICSPRMGEIPIAERKARKAAVKADSEALTFKECAEQFITMKQTGWKHAGKSAAQWRSSLQTYV